MTLNVLFAASDDRWREFEHDLKTAFAGQNLDVALARDHNPAGVDYVVYAPNGPVEDFTPFTKTKAVLGLWAGVEQIVNNKTLTQPLTRMVDSGLEEGMVEWVTGHVLRHHLGMDAHIKNPDKVWEHKVPPLARNRRVGILGMGALGAACAKALVSLNFQVLGWSRTPKTCAGVICNHGDGGLTDTLKQSDILVLLLPSTAETSNIINDSALAQMPKGAILINPGRGTLVDDEALLNSLSKCHLAHATLDVFRVEPLPSDHAFWNHPKVTITPHIASETRASTASQIIAENIRRSENGEDLLFLVDRSLGY